MDEARLIHDVFAGPEGEKALAVLRRLCRVDEDLFLACDSDRGLAYLAGRRSVFLDVERMAREAGHGEEEDRVGAGD